jgi:hypothetical protein
MCRPCSGHGGSCSGCCPTWARGRAGADLSTRTWIRASAGTGFTGHRDEDWAWNTISTHGEAVSQHALLVRRRLSDGELAFYRCWSPRPAPLRTLVGVTSARWCIETYFQTDEALGLDEHRVRRWDCWYRHTTLVMLAHAILTVIAAGSRTPQPSEDLALMPLIINEIRRLLRQADHQHGPPRSPTGWPGQVGDADPNTRPDHRLLTPRPPHSSTCMYIPNRTAGRG